MRVNKHIRAADVADELTEVDGLGLEADALEEYLFETWLEFQKEGDAMSQAQVTIWTQENCPLCQRVKEHFGAGNFVEKHASELLSGDDADTEAMVQLAMQDMQLPLVQVAGEWKNVHEILAAAATNAA